MANYIVAYTINSDSSKGVDFSDFLKDIGLKESIDQSTRYGCYEGNYRSLQTVIKSKCKKLGFTEDDNVFLFSAGKNNNLTIKKSRIN
jgi:hypothetical protein